MLDTLPPEDPLQPALRAFQRGDLAQARHLLWLYRTAHGANHASDLLLGLIDRREQPRPAGPPALVWQYDNAARWEAEWIAHLTDGLVGEVIEDRRAYRSFRPRMLVVENALGGVCEAYLREAWRRGCEVVLLHLGDEAYLQDCTAYWWCRTVFRNHFSTLLATRRAVHFLPLGWKSGFARPDPPRPAADRALVWSFAGDTNKSTRAAMLAALRDTGPARTHLTAGWETPDALPVAAYRALMDDSLFVPCPAGFSTVDTFRLYEALEAGCIPIAERRDGGEYFSEAMGPHPVPLVRDWAEAPGLMSDLLAGGRAEEVRRACHAWWRARKEIVRSELAAALG